MAQIRQEWVLYVYVHYTLTTVRMEVFEEVFMVVFHKHLPNKSTPNIR